MIRPWVTFTIVFLVLHYTGALSGLSAYSGTALMKTGIMNVDIEESRHDEPFNYNFTIKDAKGNTVDFNQFKGKTIFLNLWATWCGPCVAEIPSIESLYEKVDKEKIVFIMLDWFEEPGKVSKFIERKKISVPVYMVDGDVPEQLNVRSIPTTFVITPDGNIATKKTGSANYDTDKFKKFLEEL